MKDLSVTLDGDISGCRDVYTQVISNEVCVHFMCGFEEIGRVNINADSDGWIDPSTVELKPSLVKTYYDSHPSESANSKEDVKS